MIRTRQGSLVSHSSKSRGAPPPEGVPRYRVCLTQETHLLTALRVALCPAAEIWPHYESYLHALCTAENLSALLVFIWLIGSSWDAVETDLQTLLCIADTPGAYMSQLDAIWAEKGSPLQTLTRL